MDEDHQNHILEKIFTDEIFLRLSVKSLVSCKYVCKPWNSLISSPQFCNFYMKKSPFCNEERVLINTKSSFMVLDYEKYEDDYSYVGWDFKFHDDFAGETKTLTAVPNYDYFSFHLDHPDVLVVASCNGLVCLVTGDETVYIWNPTTLERLKIPRPPSPAIRQVTWGFGCVSSTREYKLVRMSDLPLKKIQVFSLIGFTWKTINLDSEDVAYDIKLFMGPGVWFNNMICWSINWLYDHDALEASGWDIIGFDLEDEEFKFVYNCGETNFPYGFSNCPLLMSSKDECLHFCLQSDEGDFSIWSCQKDEEKGCKFTELCDFRHVSFSMYDRFMIAHQMLGVTKTGRYLLHLDQGSIVLLHPDQEPTDEIHFLRVPVTRNVFKYVESLVSPLQLVNRQGA